MSATDNHMRRRAGDSAGLKVLIVSSDNRRMSDDLNDEEVTGMSAVLTQSYANRHSYDFLKIHVNSTGLIDRIRSEYHISFGPISNRFLDSDEQFDIISYRIEAVSSSWSNLPVIWHAITEYGSHYDYIHFMNADTTINPMHQNRSIADSLDIWSNKSKNSWRKDSDSIYWGNQDPRAAKLIFFSDMLHILYMIVPVLGLISLK